MLKRPANKSKQQLGLEILHRLIDDYPLVFWSGLYSSLLLIAGIALLNLLSAGSQVQHGAQTIPTVTKINKSQQPPPGFTQVQKSHQTDGNLSLDLFGAIAFSCAGGSLLIVYQLKRAKRRKFVKRSKPTATKTKTPAKSAKKQRRPQKKRRPVQPVGIPVEPIAVESVPIVTVLPPEQTTSRDWSDRNDLAEMLDIRKHHSLDSLLRNY